MPTGRNAVMWAGLGAAAAFAFMFMGAAEFRAGRAQEQAPTRHEFTVAARDFSFNPPRLEVRQDDLVKIVFHADDIAHSFTIDAYRIAKRAGAGQRVVFEFRADQPGRFPFYCNLSIDDRCKSMRGELVVHSR